MTANLIVLAIAVAIVGAFILIYNWRSYRKEQGLIYRERSALRMTATAKEQEELKMLESTWKLPPAKKENAQ